MLRALGLAAIAIPLYYLFRAAQARSERVIGAMVGFTVLAPVFLAAQSLLFFAGQNQLSTDFVAQAATGGDVYTLLDDLAGDNSLLLAAGVAGQLAGLALIVAMIYVPLQAMRVGLLDPLLRHPRHGARRRHRAPAFADAAAADDLVLLARVPHPRPGAEGPPAGLGCRDRDSVAERRRGAPAKAEPEEVVEGDASEVFGNGAPPKDQTARRERARKRKRKRRQ